MDTGGYKLRFLGDYYDTSRETIDAFVGQTASFTFAFLDGRENEVDLTGLTMNSILTEEATGAPLLTGNGTVTTVNAGLGIVSWTRGTTTWSTATTYRLMITGTGGGNVISASGPLIYVRSR